jgi:chemotaxis protein MotB
MDGCGRIVAGALVAAFLLANAGCVSLNEHRKLQAANRQLEADQQQMAADLYDARSNNDNLRTRIDALDQRLVEKESTNDSLRKEIGLLEALNTEYEQRLANLGSRASLGDITVAGPKLPEPLDNELQRFAAQHPDAVVYDAEAGLVKWQGDVLFALGSDVVKDSAKAALQQFAGIVDSAAAEGFDLVIAGHTDNRPISRPATRAQHPTNWHLSAHRAISVARLMMGYGLHGERVGVMGFGEYSPVADNTTDEGAARNRRVELYLVPSNAVVPGTADGAWHVEGSALVFAKMVP